LIDEGERLIEEEQYKEAIKMLEEAFDFETFRRLYASQILMNLAFANCQIGNFVRAREHILDIDSFYGDEFLEDTDKDRLDEIGRMLEEKEAELLLRLQKQNYSLDQEIEEYEDSFYEK